MRDNIYIMNTLNRKSVWLFFSEFLVRFTFISFMLVYVFGKSIAIIIFGGTKSSAYVDPSLIFTQNPILILILLIVFAYVWAYYTWYFYKYELRSDGFRKEMGIITKTYVTIPYDRIQNVDIYRGIIARILGLSDIHIQTAGMSYTSKNGIPAEGRLQGLSFDDAESLRNELIKRARQATNQGL